MLFVHRYIGYLGSTKQDWGAVHHTPSLLQGPFPTSQQSCDCVSQSQLDPFYLNRWFILKMLHETVVWPNRRLIPHTPSLAVRRIDSASLSCLWKTAVVLAGIVPMQSMLTVANWIANSETKAIGLDRAFSMRGLHFYNKTECGCVGFCEYESQEDICNSKNSFYPFCAIFTPEDTEDGKHD